MDLKIVISELVITGETIPIEIADKLLKYHLWPMNKVRHVLGKPIWASDNSGYRPECYEKQKKRSGNSEHTFKDESKGAVDWTTSSGYLVDLLNLIFQYTNYTRICYYPDRGFIHCDYKHRVQNERQFFIQTKNDKGWKFQRNITKNTRYGS